MLSSDRLLEFVTVVDEGSISSAARKLGIPRATVSRRLTGLEEELGVRLLLRSTRSLAVTTAGAELAQRARRVIADVDATWEAVRRLDDQPRGLLRVSLPPGTAYSKLLTDYAAAYPEVRLEVTTTTRHVDLRAEGIDVALRFGQVRDSTLIARRLWNARSGAVASPAYLDARGRPNEPPDLADHACLVGFTGAWHPAQSWPLRDGGTVKVNSSFTSNEILFLLDAAVAGLGVTVLPEMLVADLIAEERLERVLPGIVGSESPASVVYPERRFLSAAVRTFVDRVVAYSADLPAVMAAELRVRRAQLERV
jgi:DNA-binding transcriptional LysR family regulator